jgi:hypothetical protein
MRVAGFTFVLLVNLISSIAFASLFINKPSTRLAKVSVQHIDNEHFLNQSGFLVGP